MAEEPPPESSAQPASESAEPKKDQTSWPHCTAWWPWRCWRWVLYGSKPARADERQVTLGEYQVALGILAVLLAAIAIVPLLWDIRVRLRDARQAQLVIESPKNGDSVGLGQKVSGSTPFVDLNHYVLVTTVRTGQNAFPIRSAFVDRANGTFRGEARFGDAVTGVDDEFDIRVFTTTRTGDLETVPEDAAYSATVRVTRTHPDPGLFAITTPAEGAAVSVEERVLGRTPYPELNHYIVVTPLRSGTAFVQDERASVSRSDGTFSGRARFGAAQVGMGEQFRVRVLATKATLQIGPLISEEDTLSSSAVTVTRQK